MVTDDLGKQLHDKATRGFALSASEQAQLEAWYVTQDQLENQVIMRTGAPQRSATLHEQVETALEQLQTVTQRIQALAAQNDAVRQEISLLQRQLSHLSTSHAA